jgi:plasmid stabilization system protein ParE
VKRKVVYLPMFDCDVLEATSWFESRANGLGAEFARAVAAELKAITRHPQAYPMVRGEVRRTIIRRFRYLIFFLERESELLVIGLVHGSRDLDRWLGSRLRGI